MAIVVIVLIGLGCKSVSEVIGTNQNQSESIELIPISSEKAVASARPRRGRRAVDRVARLSLDEEALCVVIHAEQIGAFRIGG